MSLGRAQVDRVVTLSRDEAERAIAWFRFAALVLLSTVVATLHLLGIADNPSFNVLVPAGGLLALVLLVVVKRRGATALVRLSATVLDVGFVAIVFYFGIRHELREGSVHASLIGSLAAAEFFLILVVSLRADRRLALITGAASAAAYLAVIHLTVGFHPFYLSAFVLLLVGGGIAYFAASRLQLSLDRLARLQMLGQFLPAPAVDRILTGRVDDALTLGGQEVTLTVLAADLRGFTTLSESLPPSEVLAQLNAYHGVMLEAARAHGGVLDKFIGDGMLAHFGLRTAEGGLSSSADRGANEAVAAARAMLQGLDGLNRQRAARGQPPLRMGIGVHTGKVVAGNLGAPGHRMEFTLIGDAVNVAARLESATKELGIPLAVSAATVALLEGPGAAALSPAGPLTLRGRAQPLPVYALAA
jgi:adenylate cyclase